MDTSGYRSCACRDCFEIAIGEAGAVCSACEDAGCLICACGPEAPGPAGHDRECVNAGMSRECCVMPEDEEDEEEAWS